jgi:hypothetical protein
VTEALLALAPHVRRRLAAALEAEALPVPCPPIALRTTLGLPSGGEDVVGALNALGARGLSAKACGVWLAALDDALGRVPRPDLVWSGPSLQGGNARATRSVFEELVEGAEHSLWVCSYAYFDGPSAFQKVAARLAQHPALRVTLLLNIQRGRGDSSAPDALVRRFTDRFWGTDWPGEARPRVFYDPRALEVGAPTSVLHAKTVVADEARMLITSANLTEAALDRNVELGILSRDQALAASVVAHFQLLIDGSHLKPLPAG